MRPWSSHGLELPAGEQASAAGVRRANAAAVRAAPEHPRIVQM
jgi:hypothetical protein